MAGFVSQLSGIIAGLLFLTKRQPPTAVGFRGIIEDSPSKRILPLARKVGGNGGRTVTNKLK